MSGCRGSAPTEAPHTRWRGLGPDTGRTAAGGSASGPTIATAERCLRRHTTSRRLTTVAGWWRMPASRLLTFLELSIDGTERAASIIRRHSCAWQAVSDSQARSSGSSSRPSGVIKRSPRKEKPAQGPVKSIRWCGSNSIMPRSHPWPGTEGAGKSRARGPAIATRSQRRPRSGGYAIAHNVYYVPSIPGDAGVPFASITGLAMPSQEASLPACPSRLGSYGFLLRPIRVCGNL